MFGSAILGTAVGLVLLFGLTALLCSGVTEGVSNLMQKRAALLLRGLRSMLDAPEATTGAQKPNKEAVPADGEKGSLAQIVKDPAAVQRAFDKVTHDLSARRSVQAARAAAPPNVDLPALPAEPPSPTTASEDLLTTSPVTIALFNNPLIQSLQTRRTFFTKRLRNPEYIPSRTFARALIDMLVPTKEDAPLPAIEVLNNVAAGVDALPSGHLKRSLQALLLQCEQSLDKFVGSVENWYDDQMARGSGWYKRWSRVVLAVVGFIAAVLVNIDTIQVAHTLYVDAPLRQAVSASASAGTLCQGEATSTARSQCVQQQLRNLHATGLPLGYPSGCNPLGGDFKRCWSWSSTSPLNWYDGLLRVLGWLLTAFAVSFGAPFWFDALSKLGSLRGSGPKPAPAEGSS